MTMKQAYEKPRITEIDDKRSPNRRVVIHEVDDHAFTIPVADELVASPNALAGYFFRSWGRPGINFELNRVEHGCPMALWVVPQVNVLHWRARVERVNSRDAPPSGSLRLVLNPSQPGAMQCGLSATSTSAHVDLDGLSMPDLHGGWVVGGHVGLHVPVEGLLGVRIQAIAQNVRVLWSAVSQAHPE